MNKHAINLISYYLKKMMRSGYAVSSHSGLIPSETVYKKRGLLWPITRKENFINVSRGGTSATQRQKFHTDDVKYVQNPVRSPDWSTE